jgi:hypothetical protein
VSLPARFIREIGVRGRLRIYWETVRSKGEGPCPCGCGRVSRQVEYLGGCPRAYGTPGQNGCHNAFAEIARLPGVFDFQVFGEVSDYDLDRWPSACAYCGAPVPEDGLPDGAWEPILTAAGQEIVRAVRQVYPSRLYDTASGAPEPGDVFWISVHEGDSCYQWDDCPGPHCHGILPNGHDWDIDGRASNCTLPKDRRHRCWVRTGSPEAGTLHVDKGGRPGDPPTCSAGAGSIAAPGWHGHLHQFQWEGPDVAPGDIHLGRL